MTMSMVTNIATAILTFMIKVSSMVTISSTATNMIILMNAVTNTGIKTPMITNTLMTTSTATVTNMDIATFMGTRLISMIRNTRRSLIAEPRGSALISPRNWLKCSSCKAMSGFST